MVTPLQRLEDLVGCTVVHVEVAESSVVFWNGKRALLRYRVEGDGRLTEAGSYTTCHPLANVDDAKLMAARVSYR